MLTVVAGAIFGLVRGTILVSFASALGATIAFLVSRFVLREWVRRRYRVQLEAIDRGVQKEGAFYLFTLRLLPAVPFFLINLAMGLTAMRPWTFYWVSQLGMLAGTLVYINAGTHLAAITSPTQITRDFSGIGSPNFLHDKRMKHAEGGVVMRAARSKANAPPPGLDRAPDAPRLFSVPRKNEGSRAPTSAGAERRT